MSTAELIALANTYGLPAVLLYLIGRPLVAWVIGRLLPAKPTPAPIPGVPVDTPAAAPPAHPLLLAALQALMRRLGHPEPAAIGDAHPGVLARLRADAKGFFGLTESSTQVPSSK